MTATATRAQQISNEFAALAADLHTRTTAEIITIAGLLAKLDAEHAALTGTRLA